MRILYNSVNCCNVASSLLNHNKLRWMTERHLFWYENLGNILTLNHACSWLSIKWSCTFLFIRFLFSLRFLIIFPSLKVIKQPGFCTALQFLSVNLAKTCDLWRFMFLVLYTGAMSDFCLFTHTMLYTSVNGGGIALKLIVCVCFFGRPHQGRNPSSSVPRCF